MDVITIDCKQLPCPKPVLKTKDALENGAKKIIVIVDNDAAKNNVARFGGSQGCEVVTLEQDDGTFHLFLTASEEDLLNDDVEQYPCPAPGQKQIIYVISADTMGRSNDELGWALLQTFIQTIKDVSPMPEKILFYNSGVKLVTQQSGALEALVELQNRNVKILVCGTCLDFFKLKPDIKVGTISNMYDIMNAMVMADKVISPH
ncbi:MAG: sulfurtransferase-like selenium metabolism protein YedF [Desulfobulbus propionicus]|nr:MAG: sulfurtransferase-like selenium metabolism protein YedF [Desulfobulbus propionicus]